MVVGSSNLINLRTKISVGHTKSHGNNMAPRKKNQQPTSKEVLPLEQAQRPDLAPSWAGQKLPLLEKVTIGIHTALPPLVHGQGRFNRWQCRVVLLLAQEWKHLAAYAAAQCEHKQLFQGHDNQIGWKLPGKHSLVEELLPHPYSYIFLQMYLSFWRALKVNRLEFRQRCQTVGSHSYKRRSRKYVLEHNKPKKYWK